ncbi:MAG: ferritin-like protein [Flavicella sp.]|nr:ferritin-like protein [Flavicella sp.]
MILLKNKKIDSLKKLKDSIQTAIELEHATIPPYLTAMFSLANTKNTKIAGLIHSVVIEEMLHLTIACNLLNAIDGSPVLNEKGFVPTYPGPLPGGVESGLTVPIAKFSKSLVKDVFMVIEEPEHPIDIKISSNKLLANSDLKSQLELRVSELEAKDNLTIGEYYEYITLLLEIYEIVAKLKGETIFCGAMSKQVVNPNWFPESELFAITDLETAKRAIEIIVDQGEGSTTDPFVEADNDGDTANEPAHYYRFGEIYAGKELIKDSSSEVGYSYGGDEIPFYANEVPNMTENPKMSDYSVNSLAYLNSKLFNYNYTNLLNSLHETFNGQPDKLSNAMGSMYALRLYALKLMALPDPNNPGFVAGPSYEYVVSQDLSESEKFSLEVAQE